MLAAAVLLLTEGANAHESSAPPPPPKPEEPPAKALIGKHGPVLVDRNGMTLYYFERDDSGNKSTCNDACAGKRPPLAAADNAVATGDYTVITRNDGKKMWAYRYRPLYTSQQDKAPGETNGAASSTQWHIARPAM